MTNAFEEHARGLELLVWVGRTAREIRWETSRLRLLTKHSARHGWVLKLGLACFPSSHLALATFSTHLVPRNPACPKEKVS